MKSPIRFPSAVLAAALIAALFAGAPAAATAADDIRPMWTPSASGAATPAPATHHASGTVKALDAAAGKVTLAHGPVPSLEWPAMTMSFRVKDRGLLDKLVAGRQVEFDFVKEGGEYIVTGVR